VFERRVRSVTVLIADATPALTPRSSLLWAQVALLSAATDGLLDEAVHTRDAAATDQLLRDLLAAVSAAAPELLPKVSRSGELTEAQAAELRGHTREFLAREEGQTG